LISEELVMEQVQVNLYIRIANNKEYLANQRSNVYLGVVQADKLIKEKNKAEREAKLKAEGKPIPEKKPKPAVYCFPSERSANP